MGRTFCVSDLHGQYDLFCEVKKLMGEDDKCYVLGDMVDRGPHSIKIVLDIMSDKRFLPLMGNHESMMVDYLAFGEEMAMWYRNGGRTTHMEFIKQDLTTQDKIISFLQSLPYIREYKDIVMTHAGYSFFLAQEFGIKDDDECLIWDRSHIDSKYKPKTLEKQVHGHTPTIYLRTDEKPEIYVYCEGYKTCIDTGAFFTGVMTVLDLDTLEPIYIKRGTTQ